MSMANDKAEDALRALLAELPYEFSADDPEFLPCQRRSFQVVKPSNVRRVHEALWELQIYFGLQED